MALERCWMDAKQIEAARVAVTRYMKRHGKMWIRIFPQKSFTKKPLETRMGKGKAPLESWVAVIRPANVLFEVDGVTEAVARESMRLAATKLPIKTKFISRHQIGLSLNLMKMICRIKRFDAGGVDGQKPRPASRDVQPAFAAGERAVGKTRAPAVLRKDIARIETRISQLRNKATNGLIFCMAEMQNNLKRNAATARNASAKSSRTK